MARMFGEDFFTGCGVVNWACLNEWRVEVGVVWTPCFEEGRVRLQAGCQPTALDAPLCHKTLPHGAMLLNQRTH